MARRVGGPIQDPEVIRDTVASALVAGANVTITPDDGADTITIASTGGGGGGVTDHTALSNIGTNTHAQIDTHIASTANPHSVTKTQVGLGNADNTSDAAKPISTAQQAALDAKVTGPASATDNAVARYDGATGELVQDSAVVVADDGTTTITGSGTEQTIIKSTHASGNVAIRVEPAANTDFAEFTAGKGTDSWGLGYRDNGDFYVYSYAPNHYAVTINKTSGRLFAVRGLTVGDETDNTKRFTFSASGITTGTTRTLTVPDVNGTIALTSDLTTYTDEMAQDAVGSILADSGTVNFTYTDATPEITATVIESGLTLSNIGGSVTDAQVPGTITLDNLNQITTRSHTVLSDIGTNTHAQIDTHLAAAAPHSGHIDDAIVDAKGDIITATAADTPARLGVGANGTVLMADSGEATGIKWGSVAGTGDVVGPASSVDNNVVLFNGTTGKLIKTLAHGSGLNVLRMNAAGTGVEFSDQHPIVGYFKLAAGGSALGPAISNFFETNSAFSFEASTAYLFQGYCYFTKTTAGTVVWTLTSSVNLASGSIGVSHGNPGGSVGVVGVGTAMATTASETLTNGLRHFHFVNGVFLTNTAGNIRLNVTSSAGTVTPQIHSMYVIRRLSSSNIGTFVA